MNERTQSPYNFMDFLPLGDTLKALSPKELSFTYVFPFDKYVPGNERSTRRIDVSITNENIDYENSDRKAEAESEYAVEVFNVTAYGDSAGTEKLFTIRDAIRSADRFIVHPVMGKPYNVAFEIESKYDMREILTMAMVYNELLGGDLINMTHPIETNGKIIFRMISVDLEFDCKSFVNKEILNLAAILISIIHYTPNGVVDIYGYTHNLHKKADAIAMDITEAALQFVKTAFSIIEPNVSVRKLFSRAGVYEYKNRKYNTYMDWDEWVDIQIIIN